MTSDTVKNATGYNDANPGGRFTSGPIRYADGAVRLTTVDLESDGFGLPWGQTRSWSNTSGLTVPNTNGSGWIVTGLPYMNSVTTVDTTTLVVVSNDVNARDFDVNGSTFTEHYFLQDQLSHSTSNKQYTLVDTTGDKVVFWDFSTSLASFQRGTFQSFTDPEGNVIQVTSHDGSGRPTEVQRAVTTGGTTYTESYLYIYNGSGQLSNVTLRRSTNGGSTWTIIRQAAYTYYASGESHGNTVDLKLAQIEDGSGNVLDTKYYRYYTGESGGSSDDLKYVFNAQSYARLVAALGTNVSSLTDTQVAPYADNYFTYDSNNRVTEEIAQGLGCSSCSGGLGTYTYAYATSMNFSGYNSWHMKTTETLPDGNQNIVYTNYAGEVMLSVYYDAAGTLSKWDTFTKYDSLGRPILQAMPSAVTGYDDTKSDLLNSVSGNYQYLSDNTGLIYITDYGTSTTATSTTAGDVIGYLKDTKVQQGELGTAIKTRVQQYYSQTANSVTIYLIANTSRFRNTDGTGAEATSFSYTFFAGTNQVQSVSATLPTISTSENGPGTPDIQTVFFDNYLRPIWTKDGDGYINYTAYDPTTGVISKTIDDVDTTRTGDFQNLPSGWSTPAGGGLHLITSFVVDGLGRPTQTTDPNGNITYTVYTDTNYEVRIYPGWTGTATTGPTQDVREDRVSSYYETLTMTATPHTTGGVPDGTEAVSNVQTLSRQYMSTGGQIVRKDDYFNLTGLTYSVSAYIGTQSTNYYTTNYGFDERGRKNRVQTANGTIYRTVYDGLGRVVSTWIGTNDTPGNGQEWTPSNNTSPSNMIQITGNVYDTGTAPSAPTLSQTSGGTLAAATYYVKIGYVYTGPAGPGSSESSLAVAANKLLQVASPASVAGATGYNVYVSTASSGELLQNTSPIAIGTNWTEPTSGLVTGSTPPFVNGVGDGDLTQVTQIPGGSAANRVTQNFFDWRNRMVTTKGGVQATEDGTTHRPIIFFTLDNLGEVTTIDEYDGDGVTISFSNGVPNAPSASLLRAHSTKSYDDQGRVFAQQTFSVDQTNGTLSTNSLNTNLWRDHRGDLLEYSQPGGQVSKTLYDGARRAIKIYQTDGAGGTSWSAASSVTSDNVLTETITSYDSDGNTILVSTKDRFHNETTTGELGNPTTAPLARVSYIASYYDSVNRLTETANVGTNGGSSYTRPSSPPSASDTVLVTLTAYTLAGFVDSTTDPRGIVAKNSYDNLGRVTKTVQDYGTGTQNKTTEFTYDGNNNTLTIKADMAGGAYETTQYVLGVTVTGGSNVYSNDMLSAVQYPDKTTGNPSSSSQVSYSVNALGQNLTMTDRDGNVHSYSYDVLGRLTADAVTTLGTGVDGTIRRIETAYDTGDRPYLFTSYNAASGGSIVNQVQDAFNGLGQLTEEWQAHSGAVNTSTTPNIQYSYTLMSGGVNNSRLTGMTYPNGRSLTYNYATGVDNTISRLTSISDGSTTLESLSYLGLSAVVIRSYPQPGTELTYVKLSSESNGDGGDQYTGLDRFGRLVDQRWIVTSTGTALDRWQYGYDRDGNVLYSNNLVNSSFSELYHQNGASYGYDNLNQLTNFARGVLSDTNSDGIPDTISSPSHSQIWSFDALGNWSSVNTDGSNQTRTANQQNEIMSISGQTTPGYDANGNTTTDQNAKTLVYDPWNRLVAYKNGTTVLEAYSYDGLNRRITENPGTLRDIYFSSAWQVVEEDVSSSMADQYVWSPGYSDSLIERDTPTLRMYVQQNGNFDVTSLVDTNGNVQERYISDPYGSFTILTSNWATRGTSSYSWVYLHQGGRYDFATGLFAFRNRDYSPTLGRWTELDPASYSAGDSNLYRYEGDSPADSVDPAGLGDGPLLNKPNKPGTGFDDYRPNPPPLNLKGCKCIVFLSTAPDVVANDYIAGVSKKCHAPPIATVSDFCNELGKRPAGFDVIALCGHSWTGGIRLTPGEMADNSVGLDVESLGSEGCKLIRSRLKPNGVIFITSCYGAGIKMPNDQNKCQRLATECQRIVIANNGCVAWGANSNGGDWIIFRPKPKEGRKK